MNKLLSIILLLISTFTYSQTNCHIKLFDSYSSTQIKLDHSIEIKNADFSIDTVNNLITIHKLKRRYLEIKLGEYELYTEKINLRKLEYDTISRQLTPLKAVINSRFEQIWNSDSLSSDTLVFESKDDFKKHLLSYFNYLIYHLDISYESCNNENFSYSDTYRYKISFLKTDLVYEYNAIEKLEPMYSKCDEIDKYLDKLKVIYPKFKIEELDQECGNLSMPFTIRMQ